MTNTSIELNVSSRFLNSLALIFALNFEKVVYLEVLRSCLLELVVPLALAKCVYDVFNKRYTYYSMSMLS